jgi:CrcB protein
VAGIEQRDRPRRDIEHRVDEPDDFTTNLIVGPCAGGGALGSVARYWLSGVIGRRFGETFPYGTLLVNVTGCLVIGFFAAYTGPEGRLLVRPEWRIAFMAGVCGGYTTFSSFSLQTLNLTMEGDWLRAAANVILSVVLCLGAVWLGQLCATAISR